LTHTSVQDEAQLCNYTVGEFLLRNLFRTKEEMSTLRKTLSKLKFFADLLILFIWLVCHQTDSQISYYTDIPGSIPRGRPRKSGYWL